MGRVTDQREVRPIWNNSQKMNHQNKLTHPHPKRNFVPTAVATKSSLAPVNVAKQSSPRATTSICTDRHVNTVALKPKTSVSDGLGSPMEELILLFECRIIKTLMVDLLHLQEVLKEVKLLEKNRVLVTKPHNKTPYELLLGRPPSISFMRPFGCPVTILNTLDPLGKFDRKADEGKSTNGDAVLEAQIIRMLTAVDIVARVQEKGDVDFSEVMDKKVMLTNTNRVCTIQSPYVSAAGQGFNNVDDQERIDSSTQDINTAGPSINTTSENINTGSSNINTTSPIPNNLSMQSLEATGIFDYAYDDREEVGAERSNINNLETTMNVSSIPTTRIHKDHPIEQIIGYLHSAPLTRRLSLTKS
ncbi:hypothetical protein Tco_1216994 [Tanacetum coccineum]